MDKIFLHVQGRRIARAELEPRTVGPPVGVGPDVALRSSSRTVVDVDVGVGPGVAGVLALLEGVMP